MPEDESVCRDLVAAQRVLGRREWRLALGLRVGRGLAERKVRLVAGLRLVLRRVGLVRVEAAVRNVHHLELEVVKPDRRLGLPEMELGHFEPDRAEDSRRRHVGRRDLVALPVGSEIDKLCVLGELQLELYARFGGLGPDGEDRAPALLRWRIPGEKVEAADERPDVEAQRLAAGVLLLLVHHEALEVLLLVLLDCHLAHVAGVAVAVVERHAIVVVLEAGVGDQVRTIATLERIDRHAAHLERALEVVDDKRIRPRDAVETDGLLGRRGGEVVRLDTIDQEGVAHHLVAYLAALEANRDRLLLLEVGDPRIAAARRLAFHRRIETDAVAVTADAVIGILAAHAGPMIVAVLGILDLAPGGIAHEVRLDRALFGKLALPLNAVARVAARDTHRAVLHLDVFLRVTAEVPALSEDLRVGEVVLEYRHREVDFCGLSVRRLLRNLLRRLRAGLERH